MAKGAKKSTASVSFPAATGMRASTSCIASLTAFAGSRPRLNNGPPIALHNQPDNLQIILRQAICNYCYSNDLAGPFLKLLEEPGTLFSQWQVKDVLWFLETLLVYAGRLFYSKISTSERLDEILCRWLSKSRVAKLEYQIILAPLLLVCSTLHF
jgi:hypothetical protein